MSDALGNLLTRKVRETEDAVIVAIREELREIGKRQGGELQRKAQLTLASHHEAQRAALEGVAARLRSSVRWAQGLAAIAAVAAAIAALLALLSLAS